MSDILREGLHRALYRAALPVFDFGDRVMPAASLWVASREWVATFRQAGLAPGTRVAVGLPPSPAFLAVLVAAAWEGLSLAPIDPRAELEPAAIAVDAAVVVGPDAGPGVACPTGAASPPAGGIEVRRTRLGPTPDVLFLLRTSGTSGHPRTVALSEANVLAVLQSHVPRLDYEPGSVVASVLPWHHSFGLVLELLAALLSQAIVIRDPRGGRDPAALLDLLIRRDITHLHSVPLTIRRLLDLPGGPAVAGRLREGIIGGAPVTASMVEPLRRTRLRAGYGQTEAGPGLMLGEPGCWVRGMLGAPLGCEVRVGPSGSLAFRGPNRCLGYFDHASGVVPQPRLDADDGWLQTGDLVQPIDDGQFVYLGREDDAFKLANGRWVDAAAVEQTLCRSVPEVDEAVVFTTDGERLFVAVVLVRGADVPNLRTRVSAALGPLAPHLAAVIQVPAADLSRTGKGVPDRNRIADVFARAA